jgi:ferredoxin, 2Fe-2S
MAIVNYISHDGVKTVIDVPVGTSIMQAAVDAGLAGIVGECGGSAMCATCHVYIDEKDAHKFAPPDAPEREMLECTASPVRPTSRLSCQLAPTSEDFTVTVHLPQTQQ